jgi:hypothetical protein
LPSGTLYEVVGEVTVLQDPAPDAEPSQQKDDSRPRSSGRDPERTHSSGARRKSTGSAVVGSTRSGRGRSPAPRIRTGHGLRIESGVLSGIRPRIQRHAGTREKLMPFQPPPPFRLTPCRNNSSLRPRGPLQPGIFGFPRAEDTQGSQPENLPPPVRRSGRVPFPALRVPRHREQRRQATQRMKLLHPRTLGGH